MNYRIDRTAAFTAFALQAAASIATGSALAGVAVVAVTLFLCGPRLWRRGTENDAIRAGAAVFACGALAFTGLFLAGMASIAAGGLA